MVLRIDTGGTRIPQKDTPDTGYQVSGIRLQILESGIGILAEAPVGIPRKA